MASRPAWTDEKKSSALNGRLKGLALTCVSGSPDKRFSTLVTRLKDRLSPKDGEIFY